MPAITALLHTKNDALRLGRCLETLYACDEILILDHGSRDGTVRIAREYGARILHAGSGGSFPPYPQLDSQGWILALAPCESLSESLATSLFAWKSDWPVERGEDTLAAFSVFLRQETAAGWTGVAAAETRLVPAAWIAWKGTLPIHQPSAVALRGELLRFIFP